MATMKFITRVFLLISAIVVLTNGSFPFLPDCSAAETSTTAGTFGQTNRPPPDPRVLEAAEKGDPVAQNQMAIYHSTGGAEFRNFPEALKWYQRAAEQGFAPSQLRLGLAKVMNSRDLTSITEGASWLRKAAEQKDTLATCLMGRQYEEGWGVAETNYTEAAQWYARAARYGNAFAQFQLGRLQAYGRGVPRDPIEALKWFELVNNQKHLLLDQIVLLNACNFERGEVIGSLKAHEIAEAQHRAAAFVPDTSVTNDYQLVFWRMFPFVGRPDSTNSLGNLLPILTLTNLFPRYPASDMFVEVPVKIEGNRPYVLVGINGAKPVRLLFDTGAHTSFVREKTAKKLKLKPTAKIEVGGLSYDVVENPTLTLGKSTFSVPRLGIDFIESVRMLAPFEDGILGVELLQNFVVELDYRKGRMLLRDPFRYKYTGPGDYLLIQFDFKRPFLNAKVFDGNGRATTAPFLIDTGAGDSLYLEKKLWEPAKIKESLGRTLKGTLVVSTGKEKVDEGELNGFQIGHYFFSRPTASFFDRPEHSKQISGLIGGDILRRFTLIFHYGRQQLILIPNGLPLQPTATQDSASELNK